MSPDVTNGCEKQCCPNRKLLQTPDQSQCDANLDCPPGTICCPVCADKRVCHKPLPCCCPNSMTYNKLSRSRRCRDDHDCNDHQQKCCASSLASDNNLYCQPAIPCPCQEGPLCCPKPQVTGAYNSKCSQCKDDSVSGPRKKCCSDQNGCHKCTRAYLCNYY